MLVGVPFRFFGAGARVDVSKVERVGLRETAQVEPYDDSVGAVLEGGGTAHPGVALGVQIELCGATDVVFFLLALGTATAATYHQEDS
jgi:hypothetical protein